jgi:hypothetical protein
VVTISLRRSGPPRNREPTTLSKMSSAWSVV